MVAYELMICLMLKTNYLFENTINIYYHFKYYVKKKVSYLN